MKRIRGRSPVLVALLLGAAGPARAEHFEINITVNTPRGQAESHWDTTPPIGQSVARLRRRS